MNRNSLKQLVKRYKAQTANDEEKAMIEHWYELLYNDSVTALSAEELNSIQQEMWNKIEQERSNRKEQAVLLKIPVRKIILRWVAAAAMLTGLSFGIYYLFLSGQQPSVSYGQGKEQNKLAEVVNTSSGTKEVKLEDGTTIVLQSNSKLAYPNHFSSHKREVYLEGEAFFNVAKNPEKPFLVHSGNLVTQVLGTSFTIKPNKKSNEIIVSVKSGRVAVFEDNGLVSFNSTREKNNGTIITPNQSAVYNTESRNFTTVLVENPEVVMQDINDRVTMPVSFAFDEADLETVLKSVSKMYAIEIMVENENIYHCRFTGDITHQPLYDKLELICQSTNHYYEIKGTKILIKGKGCN